MAAHFCANPFHTSYSLVWACGFVPCIAGHGTNTLFCPVCVPGMKVEDHGHGPGEMTSACKCNGCSQ